ncbi:phage holin family protein [Flexivirga sp. ID2601S]|uniref:Phage holin family protein n=1 Tax=Flexivirga aerilata TaxID=1656889 RepID=A0A849ABY1_9MICO|nr:phage holin family protein [Flexivirga aerilata]NNG38035.1 phage holin family protein [Flexivirga aerilata]
MAQTTKGTERTLGQLVADASTDLQAIVKDEIALAKVEIKADVSKGGKGAGLLAAAGLLALYMLGFLLLTLAWGLHAAGLSIWLGMLITAGVLLVIVLILALLGISALKKIKGKPERTIAGAQQTVAALKPPKA